MRENVSRFVDTMRPFSHNDALCLKQFLNLLLTMLTPSTSI